MPIAVYFHPKGMTLEQYFDAHKRLEAAGVGLHSQHGRLHHSCFGQDGELMVYDVWESPEAFQVFGEKLMPILAETQIDMGEPVIMPVHLLDQEKVEADV